MEAATIARRRMRLQRLWGAGFEAPADAVHWLTAVQAQEHAYARWSVGQRTRLASAEVFDRAFDAGHILRTHVLRPTWHYVTPEDLAWLMPLSGPRVSAATSARCRQLGLDRSDLQKSNRTIARAVADGHRDRRELMDALEANGISTEGQRLAYMLMQAELDAVVCSGAMRGKQHTYAAFEERVPDVPIPDRDAALARLAERYLLARGPATADDFSWWSGFTISDARKAIDSLRPDLTCQDVDGRTYWLVNPAPRATAGTRVDLVQCFDEVIISYRESRDVLHTSQVSFPTPDVVDGFSHVVLADGRLLGHWRITRTRGAAKLETRIRRRLAPEERAALSRAIERFGRFLGEPLV